MTPQESYAHPIPPDTAPVGTARVGAELRQVRERAGWKLEEVAAALRIRQPYLEAIERGDLQALPGQAYEIGFIRTYAQALGLDGDEILRRFRAEGAGTTTKPELSFLAPVPDRAVPTGAIVLVGVVILLVGYGFWFLHTEKERRLAAAIPAVPAQLAPLAVPPEPPVVKPAPAPVQSAKPTPPAPTGTPAVASVAPAGPPAAGSPAAGSPAAGSPAAGTAVASAPAAAAPASAAAASAAALPGKVIQATADSWVEVKDASGNILFSKLMHAGDSWPVPDMPGLTLTAGNAGGTDIADNGTAGPPLGGTGTVVHNFALTAPSPAPVTPAPGTVSPSPVAPGSTSSNPAMAPK
jgi:cytoskeleton protein RodZ